MKIIRNSVLCLSCGEEIVSSHRHDFRACTCGNVYVDGGHDYLKRGIKEGADFEDTSVIMEEGSNGSR